MTKKILFVCTGNTCRSAMAEALMKSILKEKGILNKFDVSSAGVYAYEGDPASLEAQKTMKEDFGLNLSSHRAKVLDDADIKDAYLILAMTRHHQEMILDIYPEAADKVYTLKGFAEIDDDNPDISDPFGAEYEVYQDCAYEIEELLLSILDKLL